MKQRGEKKEDIALSVELIDSRYANREQYECALARRPRRLLHPSSLASDFFDDITAYVQDATRLARGECLLVGCQTAAREVFTEIMRRVGTEQALAIFGKYRPPSKREQQADNRVQLLHQVDWGRMQGWGMPRIAKEIAELNKKLPPNERSRSYLCGGSTNAASIERTIRDARRKRAEFERRHGLSESRQMIEKLIRANRKR